MKKTNNKRKKKANNRNINLTAKKSLPQRKVVLWTAIVVFLLLCAGLPVWISQSHKTNTPGTEIETISWNADFQNISAEDNLQMAEKDTSISATDGTLDAETGENAGPEAGAGEETGENAGPGAGAGEETGENAGPEAGAEEETGENAGSGAGAEEETGENATQDTIRQYMEEIPAGTVLTSAQVDLTAIDRYFCIYEISDTVFARINGKSYRENEDISLGDLRYIKLLHYNFDHQLQVGELIVNKSIATDVVNIFLELYRAEYEIQSMYLIDRYWTGDEEETDIASIDANNTSAFFYRRIAGSSKLSKHALGLAIDINPQQNPYVSYRTGSPVCIHENALEYIDRTTGAEHMILPGDICCQIFAKYGFTWGGNWNTIKDYQHFEY